MDALNPECRPTVPTSYQLLTPYQHLTTMCFKALKQYVKDGWGNQWNATRTVAGEDDLDANLRNKSKSYFVNVIYSPPVVYQPPTTTTNQPHYQPPVDYSTAWYEPVQSDQPTPTTIEHQYSTRLPDDVVPGGQHQVNTPHGPFIFIAPFNSIAGQQIIINYRAPASNALFALMPPAAPAPPSPELPPLVPVPSGKASSSDYPTSERTDTSSPANTVAEHLISGGQGELDKVAELLKAAAEADEAEADEAKADEAKADDGLDDVPDDFMWLCGGLPPSHRKKRIKSGPTDAENHAPQVEPLD